MDFALKFHIDMLGYILSEKKHNVNVKSNFTSLLAICRDYVISYDRRTRAAHWVFEHLTRDSVKRSEGVDRTKSEFREDNSIHRYFRAQGCARSML